MDEPKIAVDEQEFTDASCCQACGKELPPHADIIVSPEGVEWYRGRGYETLDSPDAPSNGVRMRPTFVHRVCHEHVDFV